MILHLEMFYVPFALKEGTFLWKLKHLRYMKKADKKNFVLQNFEFLSFCRFYLFFVFPKKTGSDSSTFLRDVWNRSL
ncbi:hypothetical protein EO93_16725 [Methanosarcina sp. 1.H.A.2.2]|nr:hypothetical protein EO93_16725 [Methanosarcina sp. 1.H.A.2.2]